MPFLAACPFCRRKVQAPDSALGQSIACKKCASYFTLAPADGLSPIEATAQAALQYLDTSQPPAPPLAAIKNVKSLPQKSASLKAPKSEATGETIEHVVATTPETPRLQMPRPLQTDLSGPADIPTNTYAAAALAFAGLAILCAVWTAAQWAMIPLAAAGFLAGVVCLLTTPLEATRDRVMLAAGGIGSVAMLLYAFF